MPAATFVRRRPADPFGRLNEAQRRAVEHGLGGGDPRAAGPLLVIAGAGSGKTLTLASRVARLILAGADPARILLLTFSRRAAAEMTRRVASVLHGALGLAPTQGPPQLAWCGTFHSVGARLLRIHATQLGLDPHFTVDDRADSEDLLHLVRQRQGHGNGRRRFPQKGTCLAIYSRVVNSRRSLADVLASAFPWCSDWHDDLRRLFAAYAAEKQAQNVLDFDDLIAWWAEALSEPALSGAMAGRFDHVLIDEYQDTNGLQAEIVFALRPGGRGLTVVGDDAQSIYSFRAADVRNILDFPHRFEPPAAVVTLERNYRSTVPLLEASNAVIALADERHAKALWSDRASFERPSLVFVEGEAEQAMWVADRVLAQREAGLPLVDQAVLFRTGSHSHALELELSRRDIPFVKYGGLKFLDSSHVKDVLAVLRFAQNPRGARAGLRAAQLVPGMGVASAGRLLAVLADAADPAAAVAVFAAPPAARAAWAEFAALFVGLRAAGSAWSDELAAVERWYRPLLDRLHDDGEARAADIAQLVRLSAAYPSRERFLTELALDPPSATSDEAGPPGLDEDYLVLSTIHSSKGQEWTAVFLLNVVDGCLPSDMATGQAADIEEERRLLYVAMTRARQHLHLLVPQRFYVHPQAAWGDRHVYAAISRFLPAALHERFTAVMPGTGGDDDRPAATDDDAGVGAPTGPAPLAVDLGGRVRARWA